MAAAYSDAQIRELRDEAKKTMDRMAAVIAERDRLRLELAEMRMMLTLAAAKQVKLVNALLEMADGPPAIKSENGTTRDPDPR